jgi:hypothetical protein
MATPFIRRVMKRRMIPAAAAFKWNSFWGLDTQLNIWMGITVKGSRSHLKERKGNSELTGDAGRKAIKVRAPTVMMGAVSPMALESPMIMPVRIPPKE